jgi:deoxyadenosine/deoxycytidine kinase
MERANNIVVEGPIGVGKTSLVHMLADRFEARTVLEKYEKNPFLEDFYSNRRRYAFQTQLFFLLSRYQQQSEMIQTDLFKKSVVSDYIFAKDKIFAQINLNENEMVLYNQIYNLLNSKIPKPDLVIFLQAEVDVLLQRIRNRNHTYEKGLTAEYLKELIKAYNDFFFYYNETPLLIINTTEIDFVNRPDDFENLVKEILQSKRGTQYYVPLSSND